MGVAHYGVANPLGAVSFRPVHAWLIQRWPACVWSVYGQVVAAGVVWLVRGCRGCLMVGRGCV